MSVVSIQCENNIELAFQVPPHISVNPKPMTANFIVALRKQKSMHFMARIVTRIKQEC